MTKQLSSIIFFALLAGICLGAATQPSSRPTTQRTVPEILREVAARIESEQTAPRTAEPRVFNSQPSLQSLTEAPNLASMNWIHISEVNEPRPDNTNLTIPLSNFEILAERCSSGGVFYNGQHPEGFVFVKGAKVCLDFEDLFRNILTDDRVIPKVAEYVAAFKKAAPHLKVSVTNAHYMLGYAGGIENSEWVNGIPPAKLKKLLSFKSKVAPITDQLDFIVGGAYPYMDQDIELNLKVTRSVLKLLKSEYPDKPICAFLKPDWHYTHKVLTPAEAKRFLDLSAEFDFAAIWTGHWDHIKAAYLPVLP